MELNCFYSHSHCWRKISNLFKCKTGVLAFKMAHQIRGAFLTLLIFLKVCHSALYLRRYLLFGRGHFFLSVFYIPYKICDEIFIKPGSDFVLSYISFTWLLPDMWHRTCWHALISNHFLFLFFLLRHGQYLLVI